MISFHATPTDHRIIAKIADRAAEVAKQNAVKLDRTSFLMDITACHANGCPLKLKELLEASPFDFVHDTFGISRHIERETGKLQDCFWPRYAKPVLKA